MISFGIEPGRNCGLTISVWDQATAGRRVITNESTKAKKKDMHLNQSDLLYGVPIALELSLV